MDLFLENPVWMIVDTVGKPILFTSNGNLSTVDNLHPIKVDISNEDVNVVLVRKAST